MTRIEVVVGRIGKPHGVRGELTVEVRTDEPERRFVPGAKLWGTPPRGSTWAPASLTVDRVRWHRDVLLVTFAEVPDRTAAEAARGTLLQVAVDAADVPEDPDEYYDHQLVGLAVHDEAGRHLGTVSALVHGGAQDLLTVRTGDGREALVPFVKALVPLVDLASGTVVVADRPGLVTPFPEDA